MITKIGLENAVRHLKNKETLEARGVLLRIKLKLRTAQQGTFFFRYERNVDYGVKSVSVLNFIQAYADWCVEVQVFNDIKISAL